MLRHGHICYGLDRTATTVDIIVSESNRGGGRTSPVGTLALFTIQNRNPRGKPPDPARGRRDSLHQTATVEGANSDLCVWSSLRLTERQLKRERERNCPMKKDIGYLHDKKRRNEKMPRSTLYDYPMACIAEEAGIDIINMGDSIAQVMLGYDSTICAKLDVMVEHAKAVRRGAPTAFIMGDMPFLSYQTSPSETIRNAGRYMVEASVDCVKIEGGMEIVETIALLTRASIPVIAHMGLTPQSALLLGGYKTQARDAQSALSLIQTAHAFEEAGAIALLVESVPDEVAEIIHESLSVPLLGTGTGPHNDSPMINLYDLLGFFEKTPRFAKRYANLRQDAVAATRNFVEDVIGKRYPSAEHSYSMMDGEVEKLRELLATR